jgi:Ca2+-binding RTX toxin-like protein
MANNVIEGTEGDDVIVGENTKDTIYGYGGDDKLAGAGNDDIVYGGTGNDKLGGNDKDDQLFGEDGNDHLNGGEGDNVLAGGIGNDSYFLMAGSTNTLTENLNEGIDVVRSQYDYTLGDNLEKLVLDGAALVGTGNGLDNTLNGNAGNNTLSGLDGVDQLNGAAGNDELFGGAGDDRLSGGDGDDTLVGGIGRDSLTGGDGADVFSFAMGDSGTVAGHDADSVRDFTQGTDLISLAAGLTWSQGANHGSNAVVTVTDGVNMMQIEFANAAGTTFTASDFQS